MSGGADDDLDDLIGELTELAEDFADGTIQREVYQTWRMVLVPAAEEEAPKRTGFLAGQINTEIDGDTLILKSNAPYSAFVHDGTSTIEANPFLERAIDRTQDDFDKRLETAIRKRLK